MKKLSILLICTLPSFLTAQAQVNYVLNGGFERYSSCPNNYDQIKKANYWQPIDTTSIDPRCSPEFCHACAGTNPKVGIPHTISYTHYPRSGNGMAQNLFYFLNSSTLGYERSYSQGKLTDQLVPGKNYCVTLFVTLAQASTFAVNRIGAYLDDGNIDAGQDSSGCSSPQISFIPQIFTTTIIDDTLNWVKIQGNFIATGAERFITIGNFFSNLNTDTLRLIAIAGQQYSSYLIDDVSVIASDALADAGPSRLMGLGDSAHIGTFEEGMPCTWYVLGNPTPIGYGGGLWVHPTVTTSYVVALDLCNGISYDTVTLYVCPAGISILSFPESLIQLYPNPATTELHIDHIAGCRVELYDMAGRLILTHYPTPDNAIIDVTPLTRGIYLVQITDPATGKKIVRKLVKE